MSEEKWIKWNDVSLKPNYKGYFLIMWDSGCCIGEAYYDGEKFIRPRYNEPALDDLFEEDAIEKWAETPRP